MPQQKNCFMEYRIRQRWKFDAGLETRLPAKLPAKSSADARASNEQVCLITQAKAV
jgi:hypothetical protein